VGLSGGGFDRSAFISSMQDMFSAESEYGIALQRRKDKYDPSRYLCVGQWQPAIVTAVAVAYSGKI
jgi:hypothetical protein